jgi:sphingolipid delta-4 desaturase
MPNSAFVWSEQPEPHRGRTRAMLKAHPELRALIGRNPWTALLIALTVAAQCVLAWSLRDQPWWLVVLTAWGVGAFLDHALFAMVHECAHGLVFTRRTPNTLAAIVANLPQFLPTAVSFRHYHIKHHSFQGVPELDADLPSGWEARFVQHHTLTKIFWLAFFPVFQIARVVRLREIRLLDPWVAFNWVVQISFNVAVWQIAGPRALAYFALSLTFSVGLHPLGARWIQEHYLTFDTQETTSYYGPLNAVALNVGYHNEHHDLPSVPWHRLPAVRNGAPEFYDSLFAHQSWSRLLVRFLVDRDLSLYSRVIRSNRGAVPLTDESRPDVEGPANSLPGAPTLR